MSEEKKGDFWVNGIVSSRDQQPYIQLSNEKGIIAQLTMAEARTIANQIVIQCSRSEADAMVHRFFAQQEFPRDAASALMMMFRDFRMALDEEKVQTSYSDEAI